MKYFKKIPSWILIIMGIAIACGGTVITAPVVIPNNAVTDAKLRDSAGLSVIGRGANTTGDPADIIASSDGDVLRRSGTSLGFGAIPEGSVTGVITDVTAGAGLTGGASSGNATIDITASSDFSVGVDLLDLSSTITAPGTLDVAGDFSVATNKFTVTASNGNTLVNGTLTVNGNATIGDTRATDTQSFTGTPTFNVPAADGVSTKALLVQGSGGASGVIPIAGSLMTLENAGSNVVFSLLSTTNAKRLAFGNSSNSQDGLIDYDGVSRGLRFFTAGPTLRLTIDSAGLATFANNLTVNGNTSLGDATSDTTTILGNTTVSVLNANGTGTKAFNIRGSGGADSLTPASPEMMYLENAGNNVILAMGSSTNRKVIAFGNSSGAEDGRIDYDAVSRNMRFITANAVAFQIDSSQGANLVGNFSVNTSQFTVTASNGNTLVNGTLTVNGNATLGDSTSLDSHTINGPITATSGTSSPALLAKNSDSTAGTLAIQNTSASGPSDFFAKDSSGTAQMSFGYGNASYSDTARVGKGYLWRNTGSTFVFARTNTQDGMIDSSGRFGIGTATSLDSNSKLHINSGTGGTAAISGSLVSIESSGVTYLTFKAPTASEEGILFSNGSGAADGALLYDAISRGLAFKTGGGTTRQTLDSNGTVSFGDTASPTAIGDNIDVMLLGQTGTGQTTSGKALINASNTGTYNATSGNITVYGVESSVTSTRSAGANSVTNIALYGTASGAQTNQALFTESGDVVLNNTSGTFTGKGAATFTSTLAVNGNATIGDANADKTTVFGHILYDGTAPSKSAGCDGSGTATVTGTDSAFHSTTGTGATACTWTFSRTFTVAPSCTVFPEAGIAVPTCTISATAITCTVVTAGTYHWMCATSNGGA